jgi:hypothetical protein
MEIAFGPCGRRTRFMGYCFSLYMATALGLLARLPFSATALGQRPKGLWLFMFKKSRDDGFDLMRFAVNCP